MPAGDVRRNAYEEALGVAEQIGDRPVAAIAAFNLGTAHMDIPAIRDLPQAERWYRRSLELRDERDRLGRGKCLGQLGYVAFERFQEARSAGRPEAELVGHLNTAVGFYHQALDLLPDNAVNDLAVTHNQLGMIYYTPATSTAPCRTTASRHPLLRSVGQRLSRRRNPLQRRVGPGPIRPRGRCPRVRPRRAPQL
jgi:tetratricopeptide (TPR) repeat protein